MRGVLMLLPCLPQIRKTKIENIISKYALGLGDEVDDDMPGTMHRESTIGTLFC